FRSIHTSPHEENRDPYGGSVGVNVAAAPTDLQRVEGEKKRASDRSVCPAQTPEQTIDEWHGQRADDCRGEPDREHRGAEELAGDEYGEVVEIAEGSPRTGFAYVCVQHSP